MKKAGELSILCESEAAVIIFSQTDKLLDFSSSSTNDVIAGYKSHTSGEKSDQPTFDQLQLERENKITLSKELEDETRKLREDERAGMAMVEEGLENAATETRVVGFGEFCFTSGSEYCQQVLQRSLLPLLFGIKK
ncbi:MADS-box protein AGL24-like [Pyrus communis]|uniref:MADS-box protein AGL24-like n=1 Tax=Pyrus communis TaxID=23211 RepID=UPI0035BF2264